MTHRPHGLENAGSPDLCRRLTFASDSSSGSSATRSTRGVAVSGTLKIAKPGAPLQFQGLSRSRPQGHTRPRADGRSLRGRSAASSSGNRRYVTLTATRARPSFPEPSMRRPPQCSRRVPRQRPRAARNAVRYAMRGRRQMLASDGRGARDSPRLDGAARVALVRGEARDELLAGLRRFRARRERLDAPG